VIQGSVGVVVAKKRKACLELFECFRIHHSSTSVIGKDSPGSRQLPSLGQAQLAERKKRSRRGRVCTFLSVT
jgi:hypothetical protein